MSRFCAIALVMVLGVVAPVTAQDHQKPEGTWTVKVLFGANFRMAYLQNFTQDGRTTLLLPTGPGHPNAGDSRVGCMGEWKKRPGPEPKEYDFTLKCLYDQNWDSLYGEIRGVLVLNTAGDRFEATFTYVDWANGVEVWGGVGAMTAERVVIKPLQ
jgi:hypothetical protein